MAKSRRRARKRNAFVENVSPKKVFARDRYRCQLRLPGCEGIDRSKVVPHPKAPTVDHIIPLSAGFDAGGTHEPANCHTACFHCNCKKSDGGGGEQLLLIG
jgi:5-methylcytosine-specific restriction endonuclease McrA